MAYKTLWKEDGIIWHYSGIVTADDISAANDEFFTDYRSRNSRYQIIDTTAITELVWKQDNIVETSANDVGASMAVTDLKIAFVSSGDGDVLDKINAYIQLCKEMETNWNFAIFYSLEEALAWARS